MTMFNVCLLGTAITHGVIMSTSNTELFVRMDFDQNEAPTTSTTTTTTTTTTATTTATTPPGTLLKFSHTKEKSVKIGATGKVDIILPSQTTLSAESDGNGQIHLSNTPKGVDIQKTSNEDNNIWNFSMENSSPVLTIEVLPKDCTRTAGETTSPATTDAQETSTTSPRTTAAQEPSTTSPVTTAAQEPSTTSPVTTTANETSTTSSATSTAEETSTTSSATNTTPGERLLFVEAYEDRSSPETTTTTTTTTTPSTLSCSPGYNCNTILKSCQLTKATLPAGSSGNGGNCAVENSAYAVVTVMIAYFIM